MSRSDLRGLPVGEPILPAVIPGRVACTDSEDNPKMLQRSHLAIGGLLFRSEHLLGREVDGHGPQEDEAKAPLLFPVQAG